jgi:hypothetical protein
MTGSLPFTGFLLYAGPGAGGVAVTAPQDDAQTNLLFGHIADLDPWWTGLALLNANLQAANVEIFALAPNGSLIGKTNLLLPAGNQRSRLLSEWIPGTQARTSDGGFVFVRSDVPLFGIELFFLRSLRAFSNTAAGKMAPGITYVPPAPN